MQPATPNAPAPLTGLVVFDQFEVAAMLGSEPRGESYVGVPLDGGAEVVVRFLSHPVFAQAARATWGAIGERFERLCAIDHPQVERVVTGGVVCVRREDLLCIVTEKVTGRDLESLLREGVRFAPADALTLAHRVAQGLGAAHQVGVVHGDLRASNVLLGRPPQGEAPGPWPILTDVGVNNLLAAALGGELSMRELAWAPDSAAPEQIRGEAVTAETDVYALGLLLYRALSGASPFAGDNPSEMLVAQLSRPPRPLRERVPGGVPDGLEALVARCLAKSMQERFASMPELLEALDGCALELETGVAPPRRSRPSAAPQRAEPEVRNASREAPRVSSTRLVEGRVRKLSVPSEPPRRERLATMKGPRFHDEPAQTSPEERPTAAAPHQEPTAPYRALKPDGPRSMRPLVVTIAALTLVCGLLGGYALATFRPSAAATTSSALIAARAPRNVRVRVRSNTPGAQVLIRGRAWPLPMGAEFQTGSAPELIEVSATGHAPRRLWIPLTEHVDAQIELVALEPPSSTPAVVPPAAAPDERPRRHAGRHRSRGHEAQPTRRHHRSRHRAR